MPSMKSFQFPSSRSIITTSLYYYRYITKFLFVREEIYAAALIQPEENVWRVNPNMGKIQVFLCDPWQYLATFIQRDEIYLFVFRQSVITSDPVSLLHLPDNTGR